MNWKTSEKVESFLKHQTMQIEITTTQTKKEMKEVALPAYFKNNGDCSFYFISEDESVMEIQLWDINASIEIWTKRDSMSRIKIQRFVTYEPILPFEFWKAFNQALEFINKEMETSVAVEQNHWETFGEFINKEINSVK